MGCRSLGLSVFWPFGARSLHSTLRSTRLARRLTSPAELNYLPLTARPLGCSGHRLTFSFLRPLATSVEGSVGWTSLLLAPQKFLPVPFASLAGRRWGYGHSNIPCCWWLLHGCVSVCSIYFAAPRVSKPPQYRGSFGLSGAPWGLPHG